MLTKITRLNNRGEKVETLVELSLIDGITEKKVPSTNLYNENGEIVDTKENPSIYEIHFSNDRKILVEKDVYDKLLTKLKVDTL